MTDEERRDEQDPERQPPDESAGRSKPDSYEVRYSQVSALVPERVARGVFSTGAVVLQGTHEFIIDFLLRMTRPHQVAARIVMPPAVVSRLIAALKENINNYESAFGGPPSAPRPPSRGDPAPAAPKSGSGENASVPVEPGSPPAVPDPSKKAQELYDQLKLPDDVLTGTYANAVMIGHTASEFSFDFITTFFPRSAVACRVFLSAPTAYRFLDSLQHSFAQYQQKLRRNRPEDPPQPGGQ